jgi:hypothetical protein
VCSGSVRWLRWSGKSTTSREASPRWVGALGPAEEERGRLVRSGDGEPVMEKGAEVAASLPADSEASGTDNMQGRRGPFLPARPEDGWDIMDSSASTWGNGTARRCAEAEHACTLKTAMRVPAAVASREGYAEQTLSVRHCPAEPARVLDAEATRGEERCASAPCLRGYTWAKGS